MVAVYMDIMRCVVWHTVTFVEAIIQIQGDINIIYLKGNSSPYNVLHKIFFFKLSTSHELLNIKLVHL